MYVTYTHIYIHVCILHILYKYIYAHVCTHTHTHKFVHNTFKYACKMIV